LDLKYYVRNIRDFPQKGILFKDITPLLQSPKGFRLAVKKLAACIAPLKPDAITGIEARGFLFASPVAYCLGVSLIPVRKPGKLPLKTRTVSYDLEYGKDAVEVHTDAIKQGQRVVVVDDLLATGGTMSATVNLLEQIGAEIAGIAVVIELTELKGRDRVNGYDVFSLIKY